MSIQTIYRAKALGPGADLWILPDLKSSSLAQKIDWYLNFQILKAAHYRKTEISSDLKSLMLENEIPLLDFSVGKKAPLLVAASNRVPAKKIVQVQDCSSASGWLRRVEEVWTQLGRPSLRIFLPDNIEPEDFFKIWPQSKNVQNVSVVSN